MSANKVLLAVSGGIDSAIAIHALQNQGFEVSCVHFNFWHWENEIEGKHNPRPKEICDVFGVKLAIINYQEAFRDSVVKTFIEDQEKGFTPNPCVFCNPNIKFALLNEIADGTGIKFIATGHYARIEYSNEQDRYLLKTGIDAGKDQSYMLCYLDQNTLARTIFPIGTFIKDEVYKIGKELGLPIMKSEESQDLCFVRPENYKTFLQKGVGNTKPGDIKNVDGDVLGSHKGLVFYTIGQRKGIEVSGPKPYYVIRKELATNTLVVGTREDLAKSEFLITEPNWIWGNLSFPLTTTVKIRYRSKRIGCRVEKGNNGEYKVLLMETLDGITPGQYGVFYNGDYVIGGGRIIG